MSNNNGPAYDICCYVGLLTISFIVLKLCGRIGWSWVWVISPIWITAALLIIVLIIAFFVELWRS